MLNNDEYLKIFHDMKNSVAVIGCSLQLMEKQHPEVSGYSYWKDTMTDLQTLQHLITETSACSLYKNPKQVEVNLYDFIASFEQSMSDIFPENVNIIYDVPDDLSNCSFDPLYMKEVLIRLFDNANDAILEEGTITLRVSQTSNQLFFEVEDTGCGMSPEVIPSIFQALYSTKTGKCGLGLTVVKEIVENLKGTISVESAVNTGSKFRICLPIIN